MQDSGCGGTIGEPKAGRGGRALSAGLLRSRRCGRMLSVDYTGSGGRALRYSCRGEPLDQSGFKCLSFGGLKADEVEDFAKIQHSIGYTQVMQPIARERESRVVCD
jgi:hypothetical protein